MHLRDLIYLYLSLSSLSFLQIHLPIPPFVLLSLKSSLSYFLSLFFSPFLSLTPSIHLCHSIFFLPSKHNYLSLLTSSKKNMSIAKIRTNSHELRSETSVWSIPKTQFVNTKRMENEKHFLLDMAYVYICCMDKMPYFSQVLSPHFSPTSCLFPPLPLSLSLSYRQSSLSFTSIPLSLSNTPSSPISLSPTMLLYPSLAPYLPNSLHISFFVSLSNP